MFIDGYDVSSFLSKKGRIFSQKLLFTFSPFFFSRIFRVKLFGSRVSGGGPDESHCETWT